MLDYASPLARCRFHQEFDDGLQLLRQVKKAAAQTLSVPGTRLESASAAQAAPTQASDNPAAPQCDAAADDAAAEALVVVPVVPAAATSNEEDLSDSDDRIDSLVLSEQEAEQRWVLRALNPFGTCLANLLVFPTRIPTPIPTCLVAVVLPAYKRGER